LLRAYEQKVEDHKDQNERQQSDQSAAGASLKKSQRTDIRDYAH